MIRIAIQLRAQVQRHPLLAFVGLTFAISWGLWGLQSLLAGADPISARWLGIIAAYGPTLAAVALAGLLRPERQTAVWPRRRLWLAGGVLAGTGVYHGIFPDGLPGILLRIVTTIPTTVLFTWCFNRTRGNLWLVVLLHTAVNNTAGFWLPVTAGVYAAIGIMTLTLIFTDACGVCYRPRARRRRQRGRLRYWPARGARDEQSSSQQCLQARYFIDDLMCWRSGTRDERRAIILRGRTC